MLEAQLHGKLTREQENLEDILTSNVFGSIKYVPFKKGLLPILRNTENDKGEYSLNDFKDIKDVTYEFWSKMNEKECIGCEPDVLIRATDTFGKKIIILVEAKYLSEKSSEANEKYGPNDQLAKEWNNLLSLSERENQDDTILLYITAHTCYPENEIMESLDDFKNWEPGKLSPNIIWISWRKVANLFSNNKSDHIDCNNPILTDIARVLLKQGLKFYDGITIPHFKEVNWKFNN